MRTGGAAVLLALLSSAAQAQFTYTTNSPNTSTITLTKYTGAGGDVSIPSTIGGRTVTVIGSAAFASCSNLTGVAIPNTVALIGFTAFQRCSGLTNVTIPNSVAVIETAAFNVCTRLPNVALPGGVTNIGNGPFAQCFLLTNISVSAANLAYQSVDGVLFDAGHTRLIQCPGGRRGDYAVPDGVTRIETMAFAGCSLLTNLALPDSVVEIGDATFNLCTNLTTLVIPGGVANIGQWAFGYCTRLAHLYFCGNAPVVGAHVLSNSNQTVVHYLPGASGWPPAPNPWGTRPTELWLPKVLADENPGPQGTPFGFDLTWAAGKTVVVESCASLFDPLWLPLQTNVLTEGQASFRDSPRTNDPSRFYRLRSP